MKNLLLTLAASCSFFAVQAQTATDFTANDCDGNTHNLYTELASGKVVVLTWVMPCGSCVNGGNAAENAVQSFDTSNPGKVTFWMADDYGDTPCPSLSSWANTNGITKPVFFSNTGNAINESNFGGTGMPHVVVISPDKTILYNKKNGATNDLSGIKAAIAQGIAKLSVATIGKNEISISPNPAANVVRISYSKAVEEIKVIAANGQIVATHTYPADKLNPSIDLGSYPSGVYRLLITDTDGKSGVQQIVKQ